MKKIIFISLLILTNLYSQAQSNKKALNSRSDTVDILNYEINLDVTNFSGQQLNGYCKVTFTPKINNLNSIDLDLQGLNVDSITSNGSQLVFNHNDTLINITLSSNLNTTDTSTLSVFYGGSPQTDPSGWGGFYFSGNYAFNLGVGFQDNPHVYGRVWFPCFDNFVEKSTYEFNIITSGGKRAHCNGELISETVLSGDTISRKWILNEEIPTYLACIAISDYATVHQTFNGINGPVPVELVSSAADTTNMKNSFLNLNGAFDAYEIGYGPYLWNKVGYSIVPFSGGAMEHATNIAYPQYAVDGNLGSETLMAHEFAHHWWGDLVTCETAEDMWINEGMAVYSEHLFLEKVYDYATAIEAIKANNKAVVQFTHIREGGYRAISGVPHEYTYGEHTYQKGALVAHNMRAYLGDSLFFEGLKSITDNYKFKNINAGQFRDELTNSTGIDMTNFFNGWVFSPGFSHFAVDSIELTPNGPDFDVEVHIQQKLRGASTLHLGVPLEITFYDINWNSFTTNLTASGQFSSDVVTIPFNPSIYILNEGNKLNQARTDEQVIINSTGNFANLNDLALIKTLIVNSISDSALLQFEHHWVAPDPIKNNINNYRISESRYWSVKGFLPNDFSATMKLEFDGRSTNGFLDLDLVPVNGDSIVLLYRENPQGDWTEYPYYTKTTISPSLAFGWVVLDSIMLGEYTYANGGITVGINSKEIETENFKIYPNPSDDFIWVKNLNPSSNYPEKIEIYDLTGKVIFKSTYQNKEKINVTDWSSGTYIILISDSKRLLHKSKFIVK
ncbi:M1 family aminopeptidase [Vicingaceae bacterium]|nr:M1 family aminopeptidase [Vicingaceae bacterium]